MGLPLMVFASPHLYIMSGPTLTRQVRQLSGIIDLVLPTPTLVFHECVVTCRAGHARFSLICMKLRETQLHHYIEKLAH